MSIKQTYNSAPTAVKYIIWIGGIALAIWGGSKLFKGAQRLSIKGDTKHNRSFYVEYLIANQFATPVQQDFMMGAGEDYIAAWYDGAKAGQLSFKLNSKEYSTKGGSAIKAK